MSQAIFYQNSAVFADFIFPHLELIVSVFDMKFTVDKLKQISRDVFANEESAKFVKGLSGHE